MKRISSVLLAVVLVLSATVWQGAIGVNPAAAENSGEGLHPRHITVLEYHQTLVPAWTEYVGPEARELFYHVHFGADNRVFNSTVPGVELSITGIGRMPIDEEHRLQGLCWLQPLPDAPQNPITDNSLRWAARNLVAGAATWGWFAVWWGDPDRTYDEPLGFSVSRTVEPKTIPAGADSIIQTVTTTVHIESFPDGEIIRLYAGVEYSGLGLIAASLHNCTQEKYVLDPIEKPWGQWDIDEVHWMVENPHEATYEFEAQFQVRRREGVANDVPIPVLPGGRADLRGIDYADISGVQVDLDLEDGLATVKTTDMFSWTMGRERSWSVFFRRLEWQLTWLDDHRPFPEIPVELVIYSTAGGSVIGPGELSLADRDFTAPAFIYEEGAVVSLVAVPQEGYRFVEWIGDVETIADVRAASTTITLAGDFSITAVFEPLPRYELTVSSTAGGSVIIPGERTLTYYDGTSVSLVATPASGYRFAGWTGDVDTIDDVSAASTTITMDDNYSVTANFEEVPPVSRGCFIATAAYGGPMADQIQILREFRDEYLLTKPLGRALVDLYYSVSPPIADFMTDHPVLKPAVRAGLAPAVAMTSIAVNISPTEKVAIVSSLALASVAMATWLVRQGRRRRERA